MRREYCRRCRPGNLCRRHKRKLLRGDCWVCNGTGRVSKYGCGKSVACRECRGSGGFKLPGLLRRIGAEEEANAL